MLWQGLSNYEAIIIRVTTFYAVEQQLLTGSERFGKKAN